MLQVAIGGGITQYLDDGEEFYVTSSYYAGTDPSGSPNDYFEPGFKITFPLEFQVSKNVDTIYVLIRKREDSSGTSFVDSLSTSNFDATVKNITTGEIIDHDITQNNIESDWDTSDFSPLVLTIKNIDSITKPKKRIRAMQVRINEKNTNNFVIFRVMVGDNLNDFGYLVFDDKERFAAEKKSKRGDYTVVSLRPSKQMVVLVPETSFSQTNRYSSFSVGPEQLRFIFDEVVNNEPYSYSILDVSHDVIEDYVSVRSAPDNSQAGCVSIDASAQKDLRDIDTTMWVDVEAFGKFSETRNIFRVYLKRFEQKVSV